MTPSNIKNRRDRAKGQKDIVDFFLTKAEVDEAIAQGTKASTKSCHTATPTKSRFPEEEEKKANLSELDFQGRLNFSLEENKNNLAELVAAS